MAFPPQFLDELRVRVSLADLVGRRVKLVRRGREQVGLCPFHNEKTPSFTLNEDKGFFHCFGCGAHGDAIAFIMRAENLAYPEAVEKLAAAAGLEVPRTSPAERARAERATTLYQTVEAAAAWYEKQLRLPSGKPALDYLQGRGLDGPTIARFRLGFAPDLRGALKGSLARDGIDEAGLVEAGLMKRREEGPATGEAFDYFRGRIMFPITDRRGRVVAFGGRIMGDGQPKYLNSPETPLFHKGGLLYGLAQAREAARVAGDVILVEGYMDVIALAQAGLAHVVAPLGTALGEEQLRMLWRLAPEPLICFDGDEAGQRAAARAIERALPLLAPGRSLRLARLPAGEDPDSLIRRQGAQAIAAVREAALPMVDAIWRLEAGARPVDTPERRADFVTRLRARSASIRDGTVRELYRREFERRVENHFGQRRPSIRAQPWGAGRPAGRPGFRPALGLAPVHRAPVSLDDIQFMGVIAACLNHPELLVEMAEPLGKLTLPGGMLDNVRQQALNLIGAGQALDAEGVRAHLLACGLGGAVAAILSPAIRAVAPHARPNCSLAAARRGVKHVFDNMDHRAAHADACELAATVGDDASDALLERPFAAAREMHAQDDAFADEISHE
ncbi:MAG: DNA primase [Alphaproteobacteria bacterium]|nr:DNA primase [Alphaproteobacteria bacterium]